MTISVASDFTENPGLRHCSISDDSGEAFYHTILNTAFAKAYQAQSPLTVVLDKVDGYAPSFLDEAFGNLVYDFGREAVQQWLRLVSEEEPHWIRMLQKQTIPLWGERRDRSEAPKVTANHAPWHRLAGNELKLAIWEQPRA